MTLKATRLAVLASIFTTAISVPVSWATAQSVPFGVSASFSSPECTIPTPFQPFPFQGFRPGFGGFHASTFAEGYLRGVAAVTAAQGQAALYQSEALKNQEVARNMFLQNRRFEMEQVFELRRLREAERERSIAKLLAKNVERRRQKELKKEQQAPAPPPAAVAQWPFPLKDDAFEMHREQINGLVSLRSKLPVHKQGPMNQAIQLALRDLYEELKADPVTDFWSSEQKQSVKEFLDRTYASTKTGTATEQLASEDVGRLAAYEAEIR
ncbi:MAG: hypothetical protein AAF802_28520 [Planctomycetota bacterium]